jgi:uncharacterized protein YbaR (Trm112 family)
MHILLTDVLTCPRCGPGFGLILLADRIDARRVLAGRLGCANCREQYPIVAGAVHLEGAAAASAGRPGPSGSSSAADPAGPSGSSSAAHAASPVPPSTEATRLAALLGVAQGPAYVLLAGDAADHAEDVSALLEDVEVLSLRGHRAGAMTDPAKEDQPGVSVVHAQGLPVATGKMQGVAVTGPRAGELLEEAARAVRPTGRLLVDPAPGDAEQRLRAAGLRTIAREGSVLLSVRG